MKINLTLFSMLLIAGTTRAMIDVGYMSNNETQVVTGASTRQSTDYIRVGMNGSSNTLAILNGALVQASETCDIGFSDKIRIRNISRFGVFTTACNKNYPNKHQGQS